MLRKGYDIAFLVPEDLQQEGEWPYIVHQGTSATEMVRLKHCKHLVLPVHSLHPLFLRPPKNAARTENASRQERRWGMQTTTGLTTRDRTRLYSEIFCCFPQSSYVLGWYLKVGCNSSFPPSHTQLFCLLML